MDDLLKALPCLYDFHGNVLMHSFSGQFLSYVSWLCIAKAGANLQEDTYVRSKRRWELSELVAITEYLLAIYFRRERHISISVMIHRNYNTYSEGNFIFLFR
jgi:hypothetical protein